ncbi:MAG: preprotein translocase subunit TatB [Actinobacteria bacterium]|nr:preprotein translocase subunit TatB [Actinomycetota bacterium]MBM3697191.1 preprotein translocase subunit TatB [Actinomycetota bacterium]
MTRDTIAAMARGQVLEVLADDPMVFLDLPAWCHDAGHEVLSMEQRRDVITSLIRVG